MKKKVLIAEDEKIIALDIRRQLQTLDYEVTSIVSTGEEAINECRRIKPDVVLMDIGLQGILSGTQAATMIFREMAIPIVHLSGLKKEFKESEINYPLFFINKPFEQRILKEILDKVLRI
jgi:CheY-like chemotaxis protein